MSHNTSHLTHSHSREFSTELSYAEALLWKGIRHTNNSYTSSNFHKFIRPKLVKELGEGSFGRVALEVLSWLLCEQGEVNVGARQHPTKWSVVQ